MMVHIKVVDLPRCHSQIQTAHLNIFIFITMNFKYLFAIVFVIATLVLDSEALFFKKRQRNNQNRRRSGGNRQRSSRNECYSDNQCWTRKCVKYDDALCGAGSKYSLCSRNFQNVKLRLQRFEILQFACQ